MQPEDEVASDNLDDETLNGVGADPETDKPDTQEVIKDIKENQVQEQDLEKPEVENALKEFDEVKEQSEEAVDQVDEAFRVVQAMESLRDVIRNIDGTPSTHEMRMLRLGMEEFVETNGIKDLYQVAMEAATDETYTMSSFLWSKIVKMWKFIIALLKRMVKSFSDITLGLFDRIDRAASVAAKLAQRAHDTKGQMYSEFIYDEDFIKNLHVEGKLPRDLFSHLTYLELLAKPIFTNINDWTLDVGVVIQDYLNNGDLATEEFPLRLNVVVADVFEGKVVDEPSMKVGGKIPNTTVISSPALPGGYAFVARVPDINLINDVKRASEFLPSTSFKVVHMVDEYLASEKVPTLSKPQCIQICDQIYKTLQHFVEYQAIKSDITAVRDGIVTAAERVEDQLDTFKDGKHRDNLEFVKNIALLSARIVEEPVREFLMYYMRMVFSALLYVKKSLDNHAK